MSLTNPDAHTHVLPSTRGHVPTCPGWKPGAQMLIPQQPTQVHPSDAEEHEGAGVKPCFLSMACRSGKPSLSPVGAHWDNSPS